MSIKPIETVYKGYRFRSRLEARCAVFFDALGWEWPYEKEGYDLGDLGWYLPDFWLPGLQMWAEIKPDKAPEVQGVYLAGKMTNWRDGLHLNGHRRTGPLTNIKAHELTAHENDGLSVGEIVIDCRTRILESDVVVCWLNSLDCYGTLTEIGYAVGAGKRVVLGIDTRLHGRLCAKADTEYGPQAGGIGIDHAMWFVEGFCNCSLVCTHPQAVVELALPLTEAEAKCAALSTNARTVLLCGEPAFDRYSGTLFCDGRCVDRNQGFEVQHNGAIDLDLAGRWSHHWPEEQHQLNMAYLHAMQARFEHGERPPQRSSTP